MMKKIAIIATEHSADAIGASLIIELKKKNTQFIFYGLGGPKMKKLGFHNIFPVTNQSIIGILDAFRHIFSLYILRKKLISFFLKTQPDIYIGIDAADFNLPIEKKLRKYGVKTIHYVSPKIWAWRPRRIKKIKQSVDNLLCIFPFELMLYQHTDLSVNYIGHPLAYDIPHNPNKLSARKKLGIDNHLIVICIMIGSRSSEIRHHAIIFLKSVKMLLSHHDDIHFVVPVIHTHMLPEMKKMVEQEALISKTDLIIGQSHLAIESSDLVLCKSGTSTLEACLFKKPMVVCYKTDWFTFLMMRLLIKTNFIALPNILSNKQLVPELIQTQVTSNRIHLELLKLLRQNYSNELINEYKLIHKALLTNYTDVVNRVFMSFLMDRD